MRRGGGRLMGLVAASLLIHLALLAALGAGRFGVFARPSPAPVTVFVDLEPRPLLNGERPRRPTAPRPETRSPARHRPALVTRGLTPEATPLPVLSPPVTRAEAPVGPPLRPGRGRVGLLACRTPDFLDEGQRADCDRRMAEVAEGAAPLSGSGDARRDARFARQGAAAMAAYAERHARGPEPPIPCPKTGPIAECALEVYIDLWSSRGGWLPNQHDGD